MNLAAPIKPIRIQGEFNGMSVTITTDSALSLPTAALRRTGEETGCPLRIERASGCEIVVLLHEELALLGEGNYLITLYDGCIQCDTLPLVMSADCSITSVKTTKAAKVETCCD